MSSKSRVWLYDHEADSLGMEAKPNEEGRNQARYYITDQQWSEILAIRNDVVNSTSPNDYKPPVDFILSAVDSDGGMMCIDKYCEHYKLPRQDISSYKLVTHTGTPFYNIVFKEKIEGCEVDWDKLKEIFDKEIKRSYLYKPSSYKNEREGVLKWSDLHFGAYIRNLIETPDFDSEILFKSLMKSVEDVNMLMFQKVHVHILGDLIESFTGLNHMNSWMSMDPEQTGANAIQMCTEMLDKALSRIYNLGSIKIVAGNHDRLSKANDEDVKGGAAQMIAYCLKLKGYDVEFDPLVIRHKVEGINHLNLHGHFGISKQSTEKILWKYGEKGCFNYISEGHLHSIIQKLSINKQKKFLTIKDDAIDHRRSHIASFFTGNFYSESGGWSTLPGYELVWDRGNGTPMVLQGSV